MEKKWNFTMCNVLIRAVFNSNVTHRLSSLCVVNSHRAEG